MRKKLLSAAVAAVMTLSLAACGTATPTETDDASAENPDAYMRIMNSDLLPLVYRRCNSVEE